MSIRLLLTNDDGFDAPGLEASWNAAEKVWPGCSTVIAPHECFSAKSHATTTHPEQPLQVRDLVHNSMKGHIIEGFPADCVRVGLKGLELDKGQKTILISGINPGGNLGMDIYYSGTVAAAREAVALGYSAVAVSVYMRKEIPMHWPTLTDWTSEVFRSLKDRLEGDTPTFWNVNMAALPEGTPMPRIRFVPASTDPLAVRFTQKEPNDTRSFRYSGSYQDRPQKPDTDVNIVFSGGIAVTPLRLDVTDQSLLDTLR